MISKKDIITMARKVTRRSGGYTERKVIHPHREWFIGVAVFIIIAVVGGVFNAHNHVYYNTLELRVTDTTVPIKMYKEQIAKDALSMYDDRTNRFNVLAATAPIVRIEEEEANATSSEDILEDDSDTEEEVDEVSEDVVSEEIASSTETAATEE